MDWTQVFRRKSNPVAGVTLQHYGGRPQWRTTNPEQLAKEGYESNPHVYAAIDGFATACAGINWVVKKGQGDKEETLDDHWALNLISRPNPGQARASFIKEIVSWRKIAGDAAITAAGPAGKPPAELYVLRQDRLTVVPSKDPEKPVTRYEYKVGGRTQHIEPERVCRIPMFHPTDDFYGLPPLLVAAKLIDQSNAAADWNLSLLQNGGIPPGFLTTQDELSDKQFARLKKQISSVWMSSQNAGIPQLLEAGLKFENAGQTHQDMQYLETQKYIARVFAMIIKYPPELLDGEQKKFANYKEARRALIVDGALPELDEIRDELNAWLEPWLDGARLDYDKDDIEELQEDRNELYARLEAASFLTMNDKRQEVGLPPIDGGDVLLVPAMLVPIGLLSDTTTIPVVEPPKEGEVDAKSLPLGRKEYSPRVEQWKRIDAQRVRLENTIRKLAASVLDQERREIVKAVTASSGAISADAGVERVLRGQKTTWETMLKRTYLTVGKVFAEETLENLKSQGAPVNTKATSWEKYVLEYVAKTSASKVQQVTDTSRNKIKELVEAGIENDEKIPDIAARIDKLYLEQIIPNRSTVIARTETVSASNAGSIGAAKSSGLDLAKEWISTQDDRTRDAHGDMDGETVPMDAPFNVDGDEMEFPGDSSLGADAANIIQCRCTQGYVVL